MALKRTQNRSKRERLDQSRAKLRAIFQAGPATDGTTKGFRPQTVLKAAWDLASDIEGFVRKYLSHYMVDQDTGVSVEPAEFHKELYQILLTTKRGAVAAPREHAKSTVVSLFFVLYCICYKLRRFIVLLSDTLPQARLLLNANKVELEGNDALIEDFGNLVNDSKWGEEDILTTTGIRVVARGAGQSLRGLRQRMYRPDLVIGDDLENDETVDNPESRNKLERWFKNVVLNLGKTCQVFLVGTILHFDSLLAHLLDEDKYKKFFKRLFQAVDDDFTPESVLWSAKWSADDLRAKEEDVGPTEFNQEFRNRPINSDTQSFKESDIIRHAFTRESIVGVPLVKLTGIDPAISKKEKADDFASVTVGIDPDGFILVLRAEGKKLSFPQQKKFVFDRYDEEQPVAIGVESVAYQKALKQDLDEEGRKSGRYIPVVELQADTDKFRRITAISPLVENGTIRFCLDGTQKKLISQLLFLGKLHDDLADALTMAVSLARTRSFKAVMSSMPPETKWYGAQKRGMMSREADNFAGRTEEQQPTMERAERRRRWA
jgi:predicted phage terminase large subunit-like protein